MSEVLEMIVRVGTLALLGYGFYVMWQLHKMIKMGRKSLDELKEKLSNE